MANPGELDVSLPPQHDPAGGGPAMPLKPVSRGVGRVPLFGLRHVDVRLNWVVRQALAVVAAARAVTTVHSFGNVTVGEPEPIPEVEALAAAEAMARSR
jgi:hypothetical protein